MSRTLILCPVFTAGEADAGLLQAMVRDGSLLDHAARLGAALEARVLAVTDTADVEALAHARGFACRRISRAPGDDPFPAFPGLGRAAARVAGECRGASVLVVNWRNPSVTADMAAGMLRRLGEDPATPVVGVVAAEDNPVQFQLLFDYVGVSFCCLLDGPDPEFPDLLRTAPFPCDFGLLAPGLPRKESLVVLVGKGPLQAMIPLRQAGKTLVGRASRQGRLYRREDEKIVRRLVPLSVARQGFAPPFPGPSGQTVTWVRDGGDLYVAALARSLTGPVTGLVHACRGMHLGERRAAFHLDRAHVEAAPRRRLGRLEYALLARTQPPAGATGLAAAVIRPTFGPRADFMAPMPPLEGLWEYVPGKHIPCLPNGQDVTGRQCFPGVFEMDASLAAVAGNGLAGLAGDLAAGRARGCGVDGSAANRVSVQVQTVATQARPAHDAGPNTALRIAPPRRRATSLPRGLPSFGEGMVVSYYARPDEGASRDVEPCFRHAAWHAWDALLRFRRAQDRVEQRVLARVQRAVAGNDPGLAGRLLEKKESLRPSVRHAAWCLIGGMWRRAGEYEKAARALDQARDGGYPKPAWRGEFERERWLLGAVQRLTRHVREKKWAPALELARKILRRDLDEPAAWEALSRIGEGDAEPRIREDAATVLRQCHFEPAFVISHADLPYVWHFCQILDGTMFMMGHQKGLRKGALYRIDPQTLKVEKLRSKAYYTGFVPDPDNRTFWGICVRNDHGDVRTVHNLDRDGRVIQEVDFSKYDAFKDKFPFLMRASDARSAFFGELGNSGLYKFDMKSHDISKKNYLRKKERLASLNIHNKEIHILLQQTKKLLIINLDTTKRKILKLDDIPAFPFSMAYGNDADAYILSRRFTGNDLPCNFITKLDADGKIVFTKHLFPSLGAQLYVGRFNGNQYLVFMDPLSETRFYALRNHSGKNKDLFVAR